mgnify:CR=1 FL=1
MAYGGYGNNGGGNPFILGGGNANNYNQPPANPFDQDPAPVDYSDNTLGGFYDDEPADTQYETVNVYDDDLQFQGSDCFPVTLEECNCSDPRTYDCIILFRLLLNRKRFSV